MAGQILIADSVATNRIVMKVRLMQACYQVIQAVNSAETLDLARKDLPDLILLDLMIAGQDGVSICKALKNDPQTADIPIIIITDQNNEAAKIRALQAGADDFMTKPLDELTLLARVRSLLRARDTEEELRLRESTSKELGFAENASGFQEPVTVAMIGQTNSVAIGWKASLVGKVADTIVVTPKENALVQLADSKSPDVYVISCDLEKPDDGLRLLSELRSRAQSRHSAVIMVVPKDGHEKSARALDLGANDLMFEGFSAQELTLRLQTQIKRKRQADRLRETVRDGLRMAVIDPLTGLYNRRYALPHLSRIAERAKTTGREFAVMVLDLDRFKSVNDTYGHNAGDTVLREIATRIKDNLRGVDMVARIGGEEFLLVMPDTSLAQARIAAERLCDLVHGQAVKYGEIPAGISVSVSIGVAMGGMPNQADTVDQLIKAADKALYSAKSDGRNQVIFSRSAA